MRSFHGLSIRKKLVGLIAVVITLIVGCMVVYFPARQIAAGKAALMGRADTYGHLFSSQLQSAVAFRDHETAREVLTSLAADPDLASAALYMSDGQALFTMGHQPAEASAALAQVFDFRVVPTADLIRVLSPIVSQEGPRGLLIIDLSTARLIRDRHSVTLTALMLGLVLLVAGVVAAWWIASSIAGRLRHIVNAASAVTEGHLEQPPIEDASLDEIGILSRAFNAMVAQLRTLIGDIRRLAAREQETLAQANRTLEERVNERTTQLTAANVMLTHEIGERNRIEVELRHAQKLEAVGRLAAGVAHEINTPIQYVGDNVNFLQESFQHLLNLCAVYHEVAAQARLSPLSDADSERLGSAEAEADVDYLRENIPRSIASTQDGIGRVAKIVQSMKSFAHPDQGARSAADINAALSSTLTIATNELKYVAEVETEFGELPAVPCYLSDLNQVFLNLLINAAHAVGDVVGASGRKGLIRVTTACDGDHAVITVSDTGTGIPESIRNRVFDPFFTTKEVGKGTGQGLALARSVIVEKHKGTLIFDTEMGKGTTFRVRLPLHPESVPGTPMV